MSIYGLSYDLFIFDAFGQLVVIYFTSCYRYSLLAARQFSERFPLFYSEQQSQHVPINNVLFACDIILMISRLLILSQLLKYRTSKHIYQGISAVCFAFLISSLLFGVFTLEFSLYHLPYRNSGLFGVFYIEHINYLWVIGNVLRSIKFVPQISLNWMSNIVVGLSDKYIILNILSALFAVAGYSLHQNQEEFYRIPFNNVPYLSLIFQCACLLFIIYQRYWLYIGVVRKIPKEISNESLMV